MRFHTADGVMDSKEFCETIANFKKNLVVGVEMERAVPSDISTLSRIFKCPTGKQSGDRFAVAQCSDYNIAYCYGDTSVTFGNEIVFAGNLENFKWNRAMLEKVEKKLDELQARHYHDSCSSHISLMLIKNKPTSILVLKNLHEIAKGFSSALYWMASADPQTVVRSKCSYYAPFNTSYSMLRKDGIVISQDYRERGLFNYGKMSNNNYTNAMTATHINRFFMEFRHPDCIRVPSIMAANMFMLKAMVFKAIELSLQGVVLAESLSSDLRKSDLVKGRLLSLNLAVGDIEFMQGEAKRLIEFLLPNLKAMDDGLPEVLLSIADKPLSMRFREIQDLWKIERSLSKPTKTGLTENEQNLIKVCMTGEITAPTLGKYKDKLAKKLEISTRMVEHIFLKLITQEGVEFVFDPELKTMRID